MTKRGLPARLSAAVRPNPCDAMGNPPTKSPCRGQDKHLSEPRTGDDTDARLLDLTYINALSSVF
jgi:hypothetical protein